MLLVDVEKKTIQKCDVLAERQGYGYIILAEKTVLCLPIEDATHYICETHEQAFQLLCGVWIIPQ